MKPFDLHGLKTYELLIAARPRSSSRTSASRCRRRRRRRRLARPPAAAAGRQRPAPRARSPVPGPRRRPNRGRRPGRPRHQDRLRPVPDRLDPARRDQGRRHERLGRHPRFRAGPGRQDQRGRRRPAARRASSAWPARPPTPSPSPPASAPRTSIGLGPALGQHLDEHRLPARRRSLVLAAYRAGIPCTIHVALGTDIVHMHPHVSGAALGEASLIDFRLLCSVVATHGARRLAEPRQRRRACRKCSSRRSPWPATSATTSTAW